MKKGFRIFCLVVLFAAFFCVAFSAKNGAFEAVDNAAADIIQTRRCAVFTVMMIAASAAGEWFTYVPVILIFLSFERTKKAAARACAALAVSSGLNEALKALFKIDRPYTGALINAGGYGFPSGHAMNSLVFVSLFLFFMFRCAKSKTAKTVFAIIGGIIVLLIGFSRLYLGVHTLSDISGGYIFGAFWAIACVLLIECFYDRGVKNENAG